jgi:hypothetical protein
LPTKGLSEKYPFQFCINRWYFPAEQQGSLKHGVDIFGASQNLFLYHKALPKDEINMAANGTKEFLRTQYWKHFCFVKMPQANT